MGHTPYGYRIEDGKAVVDEKTSEQVKELFSGYLAGLSLKEAVVLCQEKVQIKCNQFSLF
ncbi:recombinase [Clostridioides difficile]|nr:recombinase [Clostridioides difficile]